MAQLKDLLVTGAARFLNGLSASQLTTSELNSDSNLISIAASLLPREDYKYNIGSADLRWKDFYVNQVRIQGPAKDPSTADNGNNAGGARIEFSFDNGTAREQKVFLSYTPNDSYRPAYGLKVLGANGTSPGAWFEAEGSIYLGKNDIRDSSGNRVKLASSLFINNWNAVAGYDGWLRLNADNSFSSGVYIANKLRVDGETQLRTLTHINGNIVGDGSWVTGANGTTSAVGTSILSLGNATGSGTANNSQGYLRLFGSGTGYGQLYFDNTFFRPSNNIYFTNNNTKTSGWSNGLVGQVGTSDYWRIVGGAKATDSGFLEIATGGDGNEPIYVRQYGSNANLTADVVDDMVPTVTLLDAVNNTKIYKALFTPYIYVNNVPETYDSTKAYSAGARVLYNGVVYSCKKAAAAGTAITDTTYWAQENYKLYTTGNGYFSAGLNANYIGITNTDGTSGKGISLYDGFETGRPKRGLFYAQIGTFGGHGYATSSWATYFTVYDGAGTGATPNRGWIFRNTKENAANDVNVASISTKGYLSVNRICLNRDIDTGTDDNFGSSKNSNGRIYWWSPTAYTWVDYVAKGPGSNGSDTTVNGTAPTGGKPSKTTEVFQWAKRSLVSDDVGYGWIWEAAPNIVATANTTSTKPVMSLSSNTGRLAIESSAASTDNRSSHLILSSEANGSSNNVALELWRGANASWQIMNSGGNLFVKTNYYKPTSDGTVGRQNTYGKNSLIISYDSGAASLPYLALGQEARNTTFRLYVNGDIGLKTGQSIYAAGTKADGSAANIVAIRFKNGNENGHGVFIGAGGLTTVAAGESASSAYSTFSGTTENLYMLADSTLFVESNANTFANRLGFQVTTGGHVVPVKAEAVNDNAQSLGIAGTRWSALFVGSQNSYGANNTPIYWSNGVPTASTYNLNATIPTAGTGNAGKYLKVDASGSPTWSNLTLTLNGTATDSPSWYAPTSGGTAGQFLKSNGNGAPTWATVDVSKDGDGNVITSTYVKKAGDTMTGALKMGTTSGTNGPAIQFFSNKRNYIWMGYANDNGSWYLWDSHNNKNIITSDVSGNNTFGGHASSDLALSGGTMTGDINFATIATWPAATGETYPITSKRLYWSGSSDWGSIYYQVTGADKGQLCLDCGDDADAIISFRNCGVQYAYMNRNGIYGAVWNDYAEFRRTVDGIEFGMCVVENSCADGGLKKSTERLQPGANIVSDTFGFAIGETEKTKTPLAVSGRALAYPYEDRYSYQAGDPVCSGPNGTISKMTREEVKEYPDRIVGTVSEIPEYETWGTGNVKVNGRIWIKVK